jgi:hypothetical protein
MLKLLSKIVATTMLLSSFAVAIPSQAQGIFTLPNFVGDTREGDSHYNTLHQFDFPEWDSYRLLVESFAAQARQTGSVAFPAPVSSFNYSAADLTPGLGGPVPPPAGSTPTIVNGSSGVSVNPNGGAVTGLAAATTGSATTAMTTVTGTVLSPATFNAAPGLAP